MYKLLLPLVIVFLFSCKKDDPEPDPGPTTTIVISLDSCGFNTTTCEGCNKEYVYSYLDEYLWWIEYFTNGYDDETDQWMADSAHVNATITVSFIACVSTNLTIPYDLNVLLSELQVSPCITQSQRNNYIAINNYLGLVSPIAKPGSILVQDCP